MRPDATAAKHIMRSTTGAVVAAAVALLLPAMNASTARADFAPALIACRASIGKNAVKLTKKVLKAVTGCHKTRGRDASLASTDCNDVATADLRSAVPGAELKFASALASPTGKCAGLSPADALYADCPAPCNAEVSGIATFGDVADCLVCLARARVAEFSTTTHGTAVSPLQNPDRRCNDTIGSGGARLFNLVARDVTRCQALEERAGAMTIDFCSDGAFPSPTVEDGAFDAQNMIVGACALPAFDNLDSCAASQFGVAECVGQQTLEIAREFASQVLALPVATTTTTTTTTTLPPVVADPQCPDLGELVLLAHDSNVACTTNSDCAAPRTCNTTAGICVSLSDLDTGWTGHAHDSDLNDGVITRSRLLCPGPAPTCGECLIDGVDPSAGSCRCSNDTRAICDQPFAADATNCGGAVCDCYFGVPIPLSSAGTPTCIVNRYSSDISGTADVDLGSSEIAAHLRTRVYLGISTLQPCPVCGGTCSNNASTACSFDSDCGAGNTCNQDIPDDGVRSGLCIGGADAGLACDVSGINPSFPARPGALVGGGGYSLDCMPASGKNISGAGLALDVTQSTGTRTLSANLPCNGGSCPCKTCSATPSTPCNADSDCAGATCAISPNFSCTTNSDCASLNLGTCSGIKRCSQATSVQCTTNADCQNYTSGGPCQPSTCSAIAGTAVPPSPNACTGGTCSDAGAGEGSCADGPDDKTCDGVVRADGRGILSCSSNADCTANDPLNGNCTLVERRACFLDPIVATGAADTEFPVGAAAFCVPPTSSGSINEVAGLPGPTRVVNQGRSRALCASDRAVQYQPGIGGCP